MAAIYFIWIIRIRIRFNQKRYPNQSKFKKILITGRIGLHNPDPVHHWCLWLRNCMGTKTKICSV